ncbi:hypothetical protein BDZ89DRAFT_1069151 [Hymenopellis radicata]|nr:hypothetical protein BDZ89DRAFT_1069151 [Hymenopellis radicata]
MAESSAFLMIDDRSRGFVYGNDNWTVFSDAHWYNGSGTFAKNASAASIAYSFNGTSIAFSGNIPGGIDTYPFTVSIDNLLPIVLDYVVVTAGPQTVLTGRTLVVDNNSSEISYSGQWTIKHDQPLGALTAPTHALYPFDNGTHESTHIGDTATFRFEGTSVSVHTVRRNLVIGTLNVSFTVDQLPPVAVSGNVDKQGDDQQNFVFYQTSGLQAGNHTLTINVTAISDGMVFSLDYFTYEPSFSFLSEKPSFNVAPTSTTSSIHSSTATEMSPSPGKSRNIGGIIGGAISGVVILSILTVLLLFGRRRRRRERQSLLPVSFNTEDQSSTQTASAKPGPSTDASGRSDVPPQETTRRRADKIERYMGEARTPVTGASEDGRLEELQRQIDALVAENARRLQVSPPAYSDGF